MITSSITVTLDEITTSSHMFRFTLWDRTSYNSLTLIRMGKCTLMTNRTTTNNREVLTINCGDQSSNNREVLTISHDRIKSLLRKNKRKIP